MRQLKKNGGELTDNDAAELERIERELPGLQKQLDQARKQSRQHGNLTQDYRTKQQKRQAVLSHGGGPPTSQMAAQASPLGSSSMSPMHSTPQSPMMSPSPSMGGPSPSPMMQHSPMPSPMTPSPGPVSGPMSQASPRSGMNPGMHHMDDSPFSPGSENSMRSMSSPQNGPPSSIRMQSPQNVQMRMGNAPQMLPNQGMNMNVGQGQHVMRMGNINMHQQRPMGFIDSQGQRFRSLGPQDPAK